jgi:hypothetical protein
VQAFWKPTNVAEYAAFEEALGQRTAIRNNVHWLQVRRFFYRPISPFQTFLPNSVSPPATSFVGGFQHAVSSTEQSNSFLNLLVFENAATYSAGAMDYNRRRQIKLASREFEMRRITDATEFKENAYDVYLSFLNRTGYQHGVQRQDHNCFRRWSENLFQLPSVAIVGGFRKGTLGAVSLSFVIEETLFYATFFCDTASMQLHVADLMLHFVREEAAKQGLKRIFVGMPKYRGRTSVDQFYFTRGCTVLKLPAFLHINPLAKLFLSSCMPRQFRQLHGDLDGKEESCVSAAGRACQFEAPNPLHKGKPERRLTASVL